MVDGYILALTLLVAWTAGVYFLKRKKVLEKYHMTNWGPFLMWRTQGGKDVIERLSKPKRFWNIYASISKGVVVVAMFSMFALLVWEAFLVNQIPADAAPTPEMMLGIPGINPLIPIWYGILGLIVAIVVHEFAHGILTRVGNISVKALGLVFVIIPMGAFVEPDEEGITTTDRKKRMNIFAVGPATNIILALICAILFSSVIVSSAQPVGDGPVVLGYVDGSPAQLAEIGYGHQMVSFNGTTVHSLDDWYNVSAPNPGSTASLGYFYNGENGNVTVFSGVTLSAVSKGYPAYQAGLRSNMMIASLNDTVIHNDNDLKAVLANTYPGETVNVSALTYNATTNTYQPVPGIVNVTLTSKRQYYVENNIALPSDFKEVGFLGINSAFIGASVQDPTVVLRTLSDPYYGANDVGGYIRSSLRYIALPFLGLAPMQSPLADLFQPTGVFAGLGVGTFWILANCFYWIFWINMMVGLTNALPAVPLDGGFIFRDGLDGIIERFKKGASAEQRAKIVGKVSYFLALFVLFLILWQLIGPRLLGV